MSIYLAAESLGWDYRFWRCVSQNRSRFFGWLAFRFDNPVWSDPKWARGRRLKIGGIVRSSKVAPTAVHQIPSPQFNVSEFKKNDQICHHVTLDIYPCNNN